MTKKKTSPRHYYHLTEKKWGKKIVLKPRLNGSSRDDKEPEIKRICVSASMEGCFVAIYLHELDRFNIYRTKNKVRAVKPFGIPDAHITEEFWLVRQTEFIRIGKINQQDLEDVIGSWRGKMTGRLLGDGKESTEKWQRSAKKKIKKIIAEKLAPK